MKRQARIFLLLGLLSLFFEKIDAIVYDLYLSNQSSISELKFPIRAVPVDTFLYNDSYMPYMFKLQSYEHSEYFSRMFNGIIPSDKQYYRLIGLDSNQLFIDHFVYGQYLLLKPYYFEWKLFIVHPEGDIPLGRIMIGSDSRGESFSLGVISQTSIDNKEKEKINLFDGFEIDYKNLFAKNRSRYKCGSSYCYKMEDDGVFSLPSGDTYKYKLSLVQKEDSRDPRIWGVVNIVGEAPANTICMKSGMSGIYMPDRPSGDRCFIKSCTNGYDPTKDYYFDKGFIDVQSSNGVCRPIKTARCWKYAVSGIVNNSLNDCIIPDNKVCKIFPHNGATIFTGVSLNQKCQAPEGSACVEDTRPGVFSYPGIINNGVCKVFGTKCEADYLRQSNGILIHTVIGSKGCLARPGDPCKIISTGAIGRYEGESSGVNARCVLP